MKNGDTRFQVIAYLGTDARGKKRYKKKSGFKTEKQAELAERRFLHEVEKNGIDNELKEYLFEEVFELWFDNYKNSVAESTLHKTTVVFNTHVLPAFEGYKIKGIKSFHCEEVVKEWASQMRSFKSIKNYASSVFDYAKRHEFIKKNPMDNLDMKSIKSNVPKVEKDFFDKEELEEFLTLINQKAPYRWKTFFHLIAYTGARKSELLALNWSDIDFKANTLAINKTLTRGLNNRVMIQDTKTESGMRTITLDPHTMNVMKSWKQRQAQNLLKNGINVNQSSEQVIFNNYRNSYLSDSSPNNYLNKFLKNNGLKHVTPHSFRHTHITLLFEAGAKLKEVQARVGHTDIETTMNIYAHVTEKAEKETANIFSNYMNIQ